jgi:hypothetical protein
VEINCSLKIHGILVKLLVGSLSPTVSRFSWFEGWPELSMSLIKSKEELMCVESFHGFKLAGALDFSSPAFLIDDYFTLFVQFDLVR